MSYPNCPRELWKAFFPSRRDVSTALEYFERQEPLSADLWRALLWHNTGIPTAELAVEESKKRTYLCTTLTENGERVNYLRMSRLCEPLGPWVRSMGIVAMRDALSLLADDRERQDGWNALCGTKTGADAPNCPELSTARQVLAQVKTLAAQKALVMVEGGKSEPIPTIPPSLRAEVEAELAGVGKFFGQEPTE